MFYQTEALHFECTQCGKCCTGNSSHYVALSESEITAIHTCLGITRGWFMRRYMTSQRGINQGIKLEANGRCPFLQADGLCKVYQARPLQCSTYPYWPELVSSRRAWMAERKRCEGINRGTRISRTHIRKMLRLQDDAETKD